MRYPGLTLEVISNLSDTSEHIAPDELLNEKMVFVGGRYQGNCRLCEICRSTPGVDQQSV